MHIRGMTPVTREHGCHDVLVKVSDEKCALLLIIREANEPTLELKTDLQEHSSPCYCAVYHALLSWCPFGSASDRLSQSCAKEGCSWKSNAYMQLATCPLQ